MLAGDARALRLVRRLRDREFALVVLDGDLEASRRWYDIAQLGPQARDAIEYAYAEQGVVDGYHLMRPRAAGGLSPAPAPK